MKEALYRIKGINHSETNQPRLDGRYPQRVGRTCCQPKPVIGQVMFIEYVTDKCGYDISGYALRTSEIKSVSEYGNIIKVTTLNSIYEFEKVEV